MSVVTSQFGATWPYILTEISSDRRVPRPAVPPQQAASLIGVDGSLRGGLRPFPGFLKVRELDFYADPNHDARSTVIDFFPVTLRQGAESLIYGFCYRAQRTASKQADVFLDFYDPICEEWVTGQKIMDGTDITKRMHVETFGRLGYVFIQGRSPALFYMREQDPDDIPAEPPCQSGFELRVLGVTEDPPVPGPGKQPSLLSPEEASALGTLFTTGDPERPGAGQVVLTELSPEDSGLFPGLDPGPGEFQGIGTPGTTPFIPVGGLASKYQAGGNSIQISDFIVAENDLLLCCFGYEASSLTAGQDPVVTWTPDGIGGPVLLTDPPNAPPPSTGTQIFTDQTANVLSNSKGMAWKSLLITAPNAGKGTIRVTYTTNMARLGMSVMAVKDADYVTGPLVEGEAAHVDTSATGGGYIGTIEQTPLGNDRLLLTGAWAGDDEATLTATGGGTSLWTHQTSTGLVGGNSFLGRGVVDPGAPTTTTFNMTATEAIPTQNPTPMVSGLIVVPLAAPAGSPAGDPGCACEDAMDCDAQGFTGPTGRIAQSYSVTEIDLLTPEDGGTNVSLDVTLSWTAFLPSGAPLPPETRWNVFLGEDGVEVPRLVANQISTTSFKPGSAFGSGLLKSSTKYRWYVSISDEDCANYGTTFYTTQADNVLSQEATFTTGARFEARQIEGGDYAFGFFLYDSQTGRQSALSKIAQAREEEFIIPGNPNEDPPEADEITDKYAAMEIVWDSSKYDKAYIFRSVKVQDAGGTFIAGILQLDDIVDLEDIQTINNGDGTPFPDTQDFRQSIYYYKLEDKQLVYQQVFTEQTLFDDRMPSGGSAVLFNELMVVSSIEGDTASTGDEIRDGDATSSLGEIRWTSGRVKNPELFPPLNRYVPAIPTNEVVRFVRLGSNAIGFSEDRMYHLRLVGRAISPTEMHEGYGIVNHKAVDTVASMALFISPKGLKSVGPFGQLNDIQIWDDLIIDRWRADWTSLSVAFDPTMSTLFLLNPNREEAACMWMNTAMATELRDMVFSEVRQGNWPVDPDDFNSTLVERALFLQNVPRDATEIILDGSGQPVKPRVYIVDNKRERVVSGSINAANNGKTRLRWLDIDQDVIYAIKALDGDDLIIGPASTVDTDNINGCYAYMLSCPENPALEGTKVKIKAFDILDAEGYHFTLAASSVGTWTNVGTDPGELTPLSCIMAISPPYFRWVGANVALRDETGTAFGGIDFTRPRQVDALGPSFTDVTSDPPLSVDGSSSILRYRGLVLEGSGDLPKDVAYPRDLSGNAIRSISDDEAIYWASFGADATLTGRYGVQGVTLSPGLEIFLPDIHYRLLSVQVGGNILEGQRTERAQ